MFKNFYYFDNIYNKCICEMYNKDKNKDILKTNIC